MTSTEQFDIGSIYLADKNKLNEEFIYSVKKNSLDGVKYYLEKGADVNFNEREALYLCIKNGNLPMTELLIKKGALLNDNMLRLSVEYNNPEMVEFFLEKGIDVNSNDGYALRIASDGGKTNIVKILLAYNANVNINGFSPLNNASENGHVEIVELLLAKKANVNAKSLG